MGTKGARNGACRDEDMEEMEEGKKVEEEGRVRKSVCVAKGVWNSGTVSSKRGFEGMVMGDDIEERRGGCGGPRGVGR